MNTPIRNGLLQNALDANGMAIMDADLQAYAGAGMSWSPGTKKFNAGSAALSPHTYNIKDDFGAMGDGRTVYDFVANGTTTLTSATAAFTPSDTGKKVAVEGVGASGFPLVGTITYVNATTITCSVSASSSGTGKRGMIGTDDTTAFQDAIDAVDAAGIGKIIIPDGQYLIAGAIQTSPPGIQTGYGKGQLVLPTRDFSTQAQLSIEFQGEHLPGGIPNYIPPDVQPPNLTGAIICSFAKGSTGTEAIFNGGPPTGVAWLHTNTFVKFKNLVFRTYGNPKLTPLNLGDIGGADIENVLVDTGKAGTQVLQATNGSYGIIMPNTNNFAPDRVTNTDIVGYQTGITLNEHSIFDDVRVWLCPTGFFLQATNHVIYTGHIQAVSCTTVISIDTSGPVRFVISAMAIEHDTFGDWRDTVTDIADASNRGYGIINLLPVTSFVGPSAGVTISGGANIKVNNLYYSPQGLFTVATLPASPRTGDTAAVSDGTGALAWGATVTGGGSTKYRVWYNGANWTVMGK